jgi:hypothetical protein
MRNTRCVLTAVQVGVAYNAPLSPCTHLYASYKLILYLVTPRLPSQRSLACRRTHHPQSFRATKLLSRRRFRIHARMRTDEPLHRLVLTDLELGSQTPLPISSDITYLLTDHRGHAAPLPREGETAHYLGLWYEWTPGLC